MPLSNPPRRLIKRHGLRLMFSAAAGAAAWLGLAIGFGSIYREPCDGLLAVGLIAGTLVGLVAGAASIDQDQS
jgi:hypothetical protein